MNPISEAKEALLKLKGKPKFERMLTAASILTELLERDGVQPIIVGGLSLEIYTLKEYSTHDIDLVLDGREIANNILLGLGFEKMGRSWFHPEISD